MEIAPCGQCLKHRGGAPRRKHVIADEHAQSACAAGADVNWPSGGVAPLHFVGHAAVTPAALTRPAGMHGRRCGCRCNTA